MGANYGSILIRTKQTDLLKPVLEKVARERACKFYVGPSLGGWASAFPNEYLDINISQTIAREIPNDIFHLTLFDSDVFGYVFYREGRQRDQYNSCPDYIEECSQEEKERVRGQPDTFKDLLRAPEDLPKLKDLLEKDGYTFEEERMREFADLLGLRNAIGNYEYLIDGERDEISNWKQFVHIPDEREAKRKAREWLKAEKKRLKDEGLLLAELLPPGRKEEGISAWLHSYPDTLNGGFLICWSKMPGRPLLSFNPLKSKSQTETGLNIKNTHYSFRISPSGKWLAQSNGKIEVWNWPEKKLVFQPSIDSTIASLEFSHDERHLIIAETTEVFVLSLETGQIEHNVHAGSGGRGCAVMHPNGKYLVAIEAHNLCLIDLDTPKAKKSLVCKTAQTLELPPSRETDEMISNLEQIYSGKVKLDPDLPTDRVLLDSSLSGRTFTIVTGDGMMKVGFSPNGDLLFCAAESGLRVFHWDDLLKAEGATPRPVYYAVRPKNDEATGGSVLDFLLDEQQNQIVFCGSFGKICYLNLHSGQSGVLLDPPEKIWIRAMSVSSDGTALCCTCEPNLEERNREISKFQFWNYPALCKQAGLDRESSSKSLLGGI
jgi:WD40 repeat protein